MIRERLESLLSESEYGRCWLESVPPLKAFLDAAADQLVRMGVHEDTDLRAAIRPWGRNRVRIDGDFQTSGGTTSYFVELVWLPRSNSFRGNATIWDKLREPTSKTIEQSIAASDAIVAENDIILFGQAHLAAEGVDEKATDLPQAYPAILALFERFPEEDFGAPGVLIHLMESRGDYEAELMTSLDRAPSIPAVTMVNRLLHRTLPEAERTRWLDCLHRVAQRVTLPAALREFVDQCLAR